MDIIFLAGRALPFLTIYIGAIVATVLATGIIIYRITRKR